MCYDPLMSVLIFWFYMCSFLHNLSKHVFCWQQNTGAVTVGGKSILFKLICFVCPGRKLAQACFFFTRVALTIIVCPTVFLLHSLSMHVFCWQQNTGAVMVGGKSCFVRDTHLFKLVFDTSGSCFDRDTNLFKLVFDTSGLDNQCVFRDLYLQLG